LILPFRREEVCEERGNDYEDEADYYACAVGGEGLAGFLRELDEGEGEGERRNGPVRHVEGWEVGSGDAGVVKRVWSCDLRGLRGGLWRCKVCIILAWFCACRSLMLTPEVYVHDMVNGI
jgi:hypothetical protein